MGKSSKKSVPKVDATLPAAKSPGKPLKKGKREAEEIIEKKVNVKRQKKGGEVEEVIKKKKIEVKTEERKKVIDDDTSTYEDTSSSASEEEVKKEPSSKAVATTKKPPISATKKNGTAKKGKQSSSSDDSESDEDEVPKKKALGAAKNGPAAPAMKKDGSSEDSDSEYESSDSDDNAGATKKISAPAKNGPVAATREDDSDSEDESTSEDEKAPALAAKNSIAAALNKPDDSESEEESSSSDDDVPVTKNVPATTITAKGVPVAASKKKDESSDDSESDDETSSSDDEDAPAPKAVPSKWPTSAENKQLQGIHDSSEDESSDEESEDEEPQKKKSKVVPTAVANAVKPSVKARKEETSSEEASSDDEPSKAQSVKKKNSSDESSSEEEESSEGEEEQPSKTPQKKDTDVEMVDGLPRKGNSEKGDFSFERKMPKTPVTPQSQTSGSKTLFVGNLSFRVEQADVENFFKDCGELVDIRFATHPDGAFKGFGHVEFATAEAAQKALKELNGQELLGRGVRLDIAAEKGSYTPQSGKDKSSFQRGFASQGKTTIYVRGFDRNCDEHEIKGALREHFESCGEITRISVPRDDNGLKGFAYIDFTNNDGVNKALEFDQSELNESTITVEEARPRGDSHDSSGGGRGGGRSGGRNGGGRFDGRRGGGRFGSGGSGRFGGGGHRGGGGRGRGTPNKPSMAAVATGKKTTFDD